jgi:hypothetical protein
VRGYVVQYYWAVRSVLRDKPQLRKCLTRCRHCRILFLTHPRNAGRHDLGCPFGCRQAHRKQSAQKRSIEYYRSDAGKIKKKNLNARRSQRHHLAESASIENRFDGQEDPVAPDIVRHLQVVTSLIEARRVAWQQIMELVTEILRQLCIDKGKRLAYAGCDADNRSP